MINIKGNCPFCGKAFSLWVKGEEYRLWKGGMLVQNAFPTLSTEHRELLISGICSKC